MSGWISGREKQAQSTHKLYNRTFKFQNPLRQNFKRLKALEDTPAISAEHLHSVITFASGRPPNPKCRLTWPRAQALYTQSCQQAIFSEANSTPC